MIRPTKTPKGETKATPTAKTTLTRTLAWGATVLAVAAAPGFACGEEKGGLMLAVTTDMLAPKDVNVVSVSIQVGPQIKYNFIGRVTPEGEVLLPATLAIVEPEDPNATIRVRVIAFKDTKPRVLRDITTTSPRAGRIALLRMPLSFINDGSATGALPEANLPPRLQSLGPRSVRPLADPFNPYGAEVVSMCTDPDQTMIDGECASSFVDSSALPDYVDELVFPRGEGARCFTPRACMQGWREATVDLDTCTAPKGGDVANVALVTNETGDCDESGRCFVPIDKADDGWRDEGDRVGLAKGVCKKLREGARLGFVGTGACAVKTPSVPVCTADASTPGLGDAGAPDGDGGSDGVEELTLANGISAVAVDPSRLYYGNADGLFFVEGGRGPGTAFPDVTVGLAPWFAAQRGVKVVFAKGETISAPAVPRVWYLAGPSAVLVGIDVPDPVGRTIRGATIGLDHIWIPVHGGGAGDLLRSRFEDTPTETGTYTMPPASAAAYGQQDEEMWIGQPDGRIVFCKPFGGTPGNVLDCSWSEPTPTASAVEGLATPDGVPKLAVALKPDGLYLAKETGAPTAPIVQLSRLGGDQDLSGVDDGVHHFTRGIAAHAKCAYYGSKRGLEYFSLDGASSGLLAEAKRGTEVLGVAAPIFPNGAERHVYFAARGAAQNGGGVYRVKVPAPCR